MDLWEQENPHPGSVGGPEWYAEREKMRRRIWVAYCLPDFLVWDWDDRDIGVASRLMTRHVCGVCGREDDPGCTRGC